MCAHKQLSVSSHLYDVHICLLLFVVVVFFFERWECEHSSISDACDAFLILQTHIPLSIASVSFDFMNHSYLILLAKVLYLTVATLLHKPYNIRSVYYKHIMRLL